MDKKVTLGSAYDINKNLVEKYEKELTEKEIELKKDTIKNFLNQVNAKYYMLLCNDRKDYTVFNLVNNNIDDMINILITECLYNRGKIKGIDVVNDAIEIWLSIDNESYCYYLFNYNFGMIEC